MDVAAAFGIVPGLLFVFHLLSRTPKRRGREESVADEAERWLRRQGPSPREG